MQTTVKQRYQKAIIVTVLFHAALIILLIYFGFSTPLPLPGERGIMIDFGDNAGSGFTEPSNQTQPQRTQTTNNNQQENLTQDFEEAPSIDNTKTKKTTTEVKNENETTDKREVNKNALFPGRSENNSSGQGDSQNQGNQGNPTGNSDNGNNGNSTEGSGVSYSLTGRSPIGGLQKPRYPGSESGTVVVEIRVDEKGIVTSAHIVPKGTTTSNTALQEAAVEAAKKTVFDQKADVPVQKGTITYNFGLQ